MARGCPQNGGVSRFPPIFFGGEEDLENIMMMVSLDTM